ncbi:RagB/SusD family nutrient uptake outer membrane protein [Cytophagales bacterium LB-30]|uniref:RagB/SusD family nutrient uptake outer membrane protein n=1 Tax=Shiella aurantiaca TaxID=3058365 RepID=A0ABT8F881_9BACT|nr:RagB/SusD family nutrient uptake outer membrane protein [Shiella aurantiaca]MDN4166693.1 RagB/SusD family nutrient uptake outer membrane protein [Shiella aurantiaca]
MKTKITLFLGLLFISVGCDDKFLEITPKAKYFADNFFASEDQVFQGLVAAYDPLQWSFVDGRWTSTVMLGEIWSDNANAGGDNTNFDQPGWQQIDDLTADPLVGEVLSFWKRGYFGINKANLVINKTELDTELTRQYIAEAKFLRAIYYFDLVRIYGPVPVILEELDPADKNVSRNTLSEVYGQIVKDLREAIPLLPLSYPDAFKGRITRGAAQALLGKAYLYWADLLNDDVQRFDSAAFFLNEVIASGEYELVDDYNQLYDFGAANTSESVFEIQFSNEVPGDFGTPFEFLNGNAMVQLCGIRGLCASHPLYAEGWGFMLPTQSLFDSYLADDQYRRNASIITLFELNLDNCPVSSNQQNPTDYTGMWQKKYANYKAYSTPNGGELNLLKDPNQPYIRYAEVLLMYAEALVRGSGADAEAMTYIDMVRERAAGPGDNTGNFRTASQLMGQEGLSLLEVIWYERRAELAGEGDRWFDLVRSGRAAANNFPSGDLRQANFSERSLYLPAPQVDVDFTEGKLTPYPDPSLFQ